MADLKVWGILPGGTTREQVVLDYTVTGNETDGYDIVISKKPNDNREYDLETLNWKTFGSDSSHRLRDAEYISIANWDLIGSIVESEVSNTGYLYRDNTTSNVIDGSTNITQNATSTRNMFEDCSNLTTVPELNTQNVTNMSNMFSGCDSLVTVPEFNTQNVTNMGGMFYNCDSLVTVPEFNTQNVTNMNSMFGGCSNLTTVPEFNTQNVTLMNVMFYDCISLTIVPEFNTQNVTNMNDMFNGCTSLTTVPEFNTQNVTNMGGMFGYCDSLTTVPEFDTQNVTNMGYMFVNCNDSILTETSRDNILKMCIHSKVANKKLKSELFGITTIDASRWNTLPSYNDFINAGWSLD